MPWNGVMQAIVSNAKPICHADSATGDMSSFDKKRRA
jgi:hypothetical protein